MFRQIWDEIGGEHGDPLHVCVLAHAMADVQDNVHQELVWDQRALAAADALTDERVTQAGVAVPVAGWYPSLHLNLAECYRKLGDLHRAREHLHRAHAGISALADDEYGQLIKAGLDRLAQQLTPNDRRPSRRQPGGRTLTNTPTADPAEGSQGHHHLAPGQQSPTARLPTPRG